MVVDLADTACAALADFSHVGLEVRVGGHVWLRRGLVRDFGFADTAVDLPRCGVLHLRGRVRVNVERGCRRNMLQHGRYDAA